MRTRALSSPAALARLPADYSVDTLKQQLERAYSQYSERQTDIAKNSFLQSMKGGRVRATMDPWLTPAQNWVLFYALLTAHLEEMFPIIYTPTEADAIANYSHLFRRSEGLYLSPPELDKMEEDFLDACEGRELELVSQAQRLWLEL